MVIRLLLNHSQICQAFSKVQTIAESRALWGRHVADRCQVPCWPCWPRRPRARRTTCLLRWSPGWTSMGWPGALRSPFGSWVHFISHFSHFQSFQVCGEVYGAASDAWALGVCPNLRACQPGKIVSMSAIHESERQEHSEIDMLNVIFFPTLFPGFCFVSSVTCLFCWNQSQSQPIPARFVWDGFPSEGLSRWSHGGSQSMQRAFVRRTATIVADCSRIIVQLWVIWLSSSNLGLYNSPNIISKPCITQTIQSESNYGESFNESSAGQPWQANNQLALANADRGWIWKAHLPEVMGRNQLGNCDQYPAFVCRTL